MKKLKDCHGEIRPAIRADGWTPEGIIHFAEEYAKEHNISAIFKTDEISAGGLFGQAYPCVIISHPNPPQSYFDHMIIINGNIISFRFWGYSKANSKTNLNEMDRNSGTLGGLLKSAIRGSAEMELQTEQLWHQEILAIYENIWNPS